MSSTLNSNSSTNAPAGTIPVTLGQRTVHVPEDGLYARYRMDTDLDAVEKDPRVQNVDFFRGLRKNRVDSLIGETVTPNFYYAASSTRLTMLSPVSALRSRLPEELDPLEALPGLGLFSVMFFSYDVADIDFYTEAAVGIAVQPARHGKLGAVDLLSALKNDHLYSYVLSLPVNTDIAQVRGHDGYGFPKWVTPIDVDINTSRVRARVLNDRGGVDLSLDAPTPRQHTYRSTSKVSSLTSYTQIQGKWHSTFNQTNMLRTGTKFFPRHVDLTLGDGRMSDDVRSLRPIRTVQFDVATQAQMALHMPVPTSIDSEQAR